MKNKICISIVLLIVLLFISSSGVASIASVVSDSSNSPGGDWSAQPNYHVKGDSASSIAAAALSPTQIRTAYNLPSTGGSGVIAIIDAYDDPTVESDLSYFSTAMGLPQATFIEHKMSSSIKVDGGWALETSLDVQWAHAIAPSATILLVEATSSSFTDLLSAVNYARNYPGVVAISMSWGGNEFLGEASYDSTFTGTSVNPSIKFFAASGDNGKGVIWPSSSSNVIGVGGTTLNLDSNGAVISETAWSGSGGGVSKYESQPSYQAAFGIVNTKRTVPDVSYNADPNTGVPVYDSTPYSGSTGWWQVGGTSAGAPQWAAIESLGLSSSNSNFYQDARSSSYSSYFRDITSGSNGYQATTGYDYVTGLGSPVTTSFTPTASSPDYSISASPSTLKIKPGFSGSSSIKVASLNGFEGVISFAVDAPSGWTVSTPPFATVTSGGSASSALSITVPVGVMAGTYKITVTGTDGQTIHAVTVTVKIAAQGGGHR